MIVSYRWRGWILTSAWLVVSIASLAQDSQLAVPFQAPGLVHCRYKAPGGAPFLVNLRIVRVYEDKTFIIDQGIPLSGQRRLDNLAAGSHEFRIEGIYSDTTISPSRESTNTIAQTWVSLTDTNINGALLFNESLSGAPGIMTASVTVSNGLSLLLDTATFSSCILSGDGNFSLANCHVRYFSPPEAGSLSVANSRFDLLFNIRPGLQASFLNCRFRDPQSSLPMVVSGDPPSQGVVFDQCEFDGIYGLRLAGGRAVTLRGNMLAGPVSFEGAGWNDAVGKVLIEQNSFLGSTALAYSGSSSLAQKIQVGPNYYGDFHGPNNWAFASGRGSSVQLDAFDLPAKDKVSFKGKDLQNRKFPTNTEDPPTLFNLGVRVGQNSFSGIGPIIRQGRETLVSVDLACSWKQVSGVQVYAELDGVRFDSVQQVDLFRDWFDAGSSGTAAAAKVATGETTFNIILPAQSKGSADLKVFLDSTKSSAFGTNGSVQQLAAQTLSLTPAPERPLRILVVPVQIKLTGYPTNAPTAAPVATALRKLIPAFLPLKQEELRIDTDTVHVYSADDAGFFDSWTIYSLSYTLTEWLQTYLDEYNALGSGAPYDRIVGVVPAGTFAGSADGVNVATSRQAMLVEESKPTAAIHELGHSFGLYTWKEEYNIVEGGYSVDHVTGFLPESSISLAGIPGLADIARIRHFDLSFHDFYTDIMGSLDPQWIIPGTLRDFGTSILSLLATKTRTATFQPLALSPAPAPTGKRKVLISGAYARLGSPWPWDQKLPSYVFIRDTLSAVDVTDQPDLNVPSSNGGQADPMNFQTLDDGLLNIWADSQYINIPGPSDERSPIGFWMQTFEYTPTAAYLSITSSKDDPGHVAGDPFLFLPQDTHLAVTVKSPQNGARLDDSFLLDLQSTRPVTHWLFYSADGNTWIRFGQPLRGNQHRLTTGFLPSGSTVTLRIRSSDGLSTVVNDVTGLILSSSPQVVITQPAGAKVLNPATLSALAGNAPGLLANSITWSSSLDGNLGSGESVPNVVLSPGTHTLTCAVNLPNGATASAQKQITVLGDATTAADPSLTTNSLVVLSAVLPQGQLVLHRTNRLAVTAFNSSSSAQAFLRVYAQAPGAQEQLLQESFIEWNGPTTTEAVPYQPTLPGIHRIRALLAGADPDANPANNEFVWSVPVQPVGISVTIEPAEAIAAGAQWRIDNGDWNVSGALLPFTAAASVPALINFKPVPGWRTPMPYSIDKDISSAIGFTAKYQPDNGRVPYISPVRSFRYVGLESYVSLSYYVLGQPKPIYSWFKDGALLTGSNTASLLFPAVQASNAGTYFLTASNSAGLVQGMPVTLVITNAGPTFATWSQRWPNIGGVLADADGDGIPNLMEYAFALDPTVPDRQGWPVPGLLVTNGVPYFTLAYTRPKVASDLTYSFLTSSRLPNWDNQLTLQTLRTVDHGDTLSVTVGLPADGVGGAAGFIYFRVIKQ